jgi:hypothetical protein
LETEIEEKKMLKSKCATVIFLVVCLSITIMAFGRGFPFAIITPPLWAQEQYNKEIRGTEDGVIVKCEMYLMGKTGEGVIISERLFRILPSTVMLDNEGRKITLWELRVPSIASVEYSMKTDNSTPTIISLQLLSEPQKSIEKKRNFGRRIKSIKHF